MTDTSCHKYISIASLEILIQRASFRNNRSIWNYYLSRSYLIQSPLFDSNRHENEWYSITSHVRDRNAFVRETNFAIAHSRHAAIVTRGKNDAGAVRRSSGFSLSLSGRRLNANERDERLQFKGDDDHLWRHLFARRGAGVFSRGGSPPPRTESRNEGWQSTIDDRGDSNAHFIPTRI